MILYWFFRVGRPIEIPFLDRVLQFFGIHLTGFREFYDPFP